MNSQPCKLLWAGEYSVFNSRKEKHGCGNLATSEILAHKMLFPWRKRKVKMISIIREPIFLNILANIFIFLIILKLWFSFPPH